MPVSALKRLAVSAVRSKLERLPPEFVESILYRSVLRHNFSNVYSSRLVRNREAVWDFSIETLGGASKVLLLEFGVHEGYSMRYFLRAFRNAESRFYGFDSFEGLPEVWGHKAIGTFSTDGRVPEIDDRRVTWVKGWFQDTLPRFEIPGGFAAVLVHLDADLYSSTLFTLAQLWGRVPSFYAIFDEFFGHETRALYNFAQAFPSSIEFLAHDDPVLPRRVFCRITSRTYDRN